MGSESSMDTIPIVDLSPFFETSNESGKEMAKAMVEEACRTYDFFRIVNHGVSTALMKQAIELSKDFFSRPCEEKTKLGPVTESEFLLPTGYIHRADVTGDKFEYLLLRKPNLGINIYPPQPPEYRSTLDECYGQLSKAALLVESILTDCMGLPQNSIKKHDKDRNSDVMVAMRYFALTGAPTEINIGLAEHQDAGCFGFVIQDEVGGLEVLKEGKWISADPLEGSIVVNIGDMLKVMTNNTLVSATHKVVRKERDRYSYTFFFNVDGDEWIEPLPRFTSEIGVPPKYKGFRYKDYVQLRRKSKSLPRDKFVDISHYSI